MARPGPIVGTLITAVARAGASPCRSPAAWPSSWSSSARASLRRPIGTAVELLAGIPSIVYGMWGLFVFAPVFAKHVELPLMTAAPARLAAGRR